MRQGIYIMANDRVADHAIALLTSLRAHDPDVPVVMIPFNDEYEDIWTILRTHFNVQLFPDLDFLNKLTQDIADIFPREFLRLPNKLRKLAVWFGPLDEFIYIDTDILLFRSIAETFKYLKQADFICCDFHQKSRGLADVFSPLVKEQNIFTESQLQDLFNSGFIGSRKNVFSYPKMLNWLQECATHREYFDFSSGTTDQPLLNYLVLKGTDRRVNITKANPKEPGSWGGSPHFREQDHVLYDGDRPLRYLHWAGTPICPGGVYWNIWEYYRFQVVKEPLTPIKPPQKTSLWQRLQKRIQPIKSFYSTRHLG